jgi:hypothetical protein
MFRGETVKHIHPVETIAIAVLIIPLDEVLLAMDRPDESSVNAMRQQANASRTATPVSHRASIGSHYCLADPPCMRPGVLLTSGMLEPAHVSQHQSPEWSDRVLGGMPERYAHW